MLLGPTMLNAVIRAPLSPRQARALEKAAALAGKLAAAEERQAAVREGIRERPRSANAHREAQVAELREREKERAEQAQEVRCPSFS